MLINLSEIPEEGTTIQFGRDKGELNAILKDLIGDSSYQIEMTLVPLNSKDFELTGFAKSSFLESCSHCGIDFKYRVDVKFHEILTPFLEMPRGGKYAKVNHISDSEDEGLSAYNYRDNIFDFGEYIHEVIALSIPLNPAPDVDTQGSCVDCGLDVNHHDFGHDEEMIVSEEELKPFSVLKNLKLN